MGWGKGRVEWVGQGRVVNDNRKGMPTPDAEIAERKEDNEIDGVSGGMIGLRGSGHGVEVVRGVARSFGGGRSIDSAAIVVGAVAASSRSARM
jgi:hypothetical protein